MREIDGRSTLCILIWDYREGEGGGAKMVVLYGGLGPRWVRPWDWDTEGWGVVDSLVDTCVRCLVRAGLGLLEQGVWCTVPNFEDGMTRGKAIDGSEWTAAG